MKVVCTKIFDIPQTQDYLITGKIYDFGYEDDAPVLYNKDGSYSRLSDFQIPFFTSLSEIREERINKILE